MGSTDSEKSIKIQQYIVFCFGIFALIGFLFSATLWVSKRQTQYQEYKDTNTIKWKTLIDEKTCVEVNFIADQSGYPIHTVYKCDGRLYVGPYLNYSPF